MEKVSKRLFFEKRNTQKFKSLQPDYKDSKDKCYGLDLKGALKVHVLHEVIPSATVLTGNCITPALTHL